ncbi:MAG: PIN domain-containing protein [Acidobacteria bacterium]|nr:PIN domain-containing protein [Acidobacteriota bacterium]
MTVLVDTSAFFALLDADDEHHADAAPVWRDLVLADAPLLTHSYVLLETVALLQRRLGLEAVSAFRDDLLHPVRSVWIDEETHERAMAALVASGDRGVSLVDRVSFEVMRARGIRRVFAFDPDFARAGFEVVPGP